MFDPNTSLFGYQSDSPAARAAYDMMVMQELGYLNADLKEGELNANAGENQSGRRFW